MSKKHLSSQFIKTLEPQGKRVDYYDQHLIDPETNTLKRKGVKGLILRITEAGNKYFYFNYWYDSKSKRYKIGSYPNIGLKEAREQARDLAGKVNAGYDPQVEKNKRKQRKKTFNYLATEYKQKYLCNLREKTATEYRRIIEKELEPKLGNTQLKEIDKDQIISLLDDKAYRQNCPTMANRIRARLSTMFTFALKRGLVESNPVTATPTYENGNTKRDRFYNEDEIQELWNCFEDWQEPAQSVLKMLLVCGQRKSETMKMKWSDIRGDVWTIPAKIAKNGQPHDVPLSEMALYIIEGMKPLTGGTDYVFCSPQLENEPISYIRRASHNIKKHSSISDFRPHDLRRTFATFAAKLSVNRTVLGKILNHKGLAGDSQVTAIYDRHSYNKEKRQALNRWSHKLQQIIEGKAETKITRIG